MPLDSNGITVRVSINAVRADEFFVWSHSDNVILRNKYTTLD